MASTAIAGLDQNGLGLCLECNYSLRGLPDQRCPECGRTFDPGDPRTMNMGRPIGRGLRCCLRPVGRVHLGLTILSALLLLAGASSPAGYFLVLSAGMVGFLLLGSWWFFRLAVATAVAGFYRQPGPHRATHPSWWLWAPSVALGTVLLLMLDVPAEATFRLSRPAMDRLARDVLATPARTEPDRWIGLYPARNIRVSDAGFQFEMRYGFLDWSGLLYSPDRTPPSRFKTSYHALDGGWFSWTERF